MKDLQLPSRKQARRKAACATLAAIAGIFWIITFLLVYSTI